jgi:hypothetical protein
MLISFGSNTPRKGSIIAYDEDKRKQSIAELTDNTTGE